MEQSNPSRDNVTSLFPSSMDLLMAVPRLLQRAGSFAEHIDSLFGKIHYGGSVIAEPTSSKIANATIITSSSFVQESLAAASAASSGSPAAVNNLSPIQVLNNVGGFLSYMTSKWAIATFTTAILLNRTQFYASSRIPLSLDRWHLRLALYTLPVIMFIYRIKWILEAVRCQTSPEWSQMQYGTPGMGLDTDFAGEGGVLWRLSSALLIWQDQEMSCRAANMFPLGPSLPRPAGSLSLLWPLFVSLGFSQFVETLASALQNRSLMPETGMTIFEHSLAYAEAEAVVTKPFNVESAGLLRSTTINTPDGTSLVLSRSAITKFANVPLEVLVISLISSLNHLSSNFLAMVGLRAKFRLVSTGIWGLAYMFAFVWSFVRAANMSEDPRIQGRILRFPTVCIIGFIPHVLIMVGIIACGAIYTLAFLLTVLSPPPVQPVPSSLAGRLKAAYRNLQANIHLSTMRPMRINWQEDFYTVILKCGFTVLTAASEAVYLNEGIRVTVNPVTWLEEKRFQELIARRRLLQQTLDVVPAELRGDAITDGVDLVDQEDYGQRTIRQRSGYARERKRDTNMASDASRATGRGNGVGLEQRQGRWALMYQFYKGIFWLLMALYAKMAISILRKLRITYRPAWLMRLAGPETDRKTVSRETHGGVQQDQNIREFWMVNDNGERSLPSDMNIDVEAETRRFEGAHIYEHTQETAEDLLDNKLYDWWKTGGWWGDIDTSGDYEPSTLDDDTTSVVSMATTTTDEQDWPDIEEGQRTPTQEVPFPHHGEDTLADDSLIDMHRLSRLLDPQTPKQREEARLLARHLRSEHILTRSKYRDTIEHEQTRVLTSSGYRPSSLKDKTQLTAEEEEMVLERFIVKRRSNKAAPSTNGTAATWNTGADGMGSEGPQCVVCQLSPRTVLVWPCGCLSLCDDCRVGLASKNYTTCVCCRTNVAAYSRLYVP